MALCAIRVSHVEMAGTIFWNLDHDISAMASPDALEAKNTGDEEND